MRDATFTTPDLTTFTGLDDLGLQTVGQCVKPDKAVLACRVVAEDRWCRRCGCEGRVRDSTVRELAHAPLGWRPTTLRVRLRRYRCTGCGHVWRQDLSCAAAPRCKLTKTALAWALEGLVVAHLSMARIADALGVAWGTANTAVLAEGRRVLISDDTRFEGVHVIGVDEHVWRHTRKGDKYVTVIIDLTGVRDGTGTARLLDMIDGRSKAVFKTWLNQRDQAWREGIEAIAMDGFTGFKTAAAEEVPQAVAVMDPFHVVHLAADALDECRRRTQRDIFGRRGRTGDPLYRARRSLHTGAELLNDKQKARLQDLFADERHTAVEITWSVYQRTITAYRAPDRTAGKTTMTTLIDTIGAGVPAGLPEVARLGRTLRKRADDILAFFDRPGTSNGPTEAINGRLEHLRGIALGFRNLTHYIARSLLEAGGFKRHLHP
ncbi:ISL3 family transposase [Mobilicoccus pelagius]|uniref:Putative transposase n=1 Tax=Mobilicoccus pelagius NBRC 104925 TaxID=1089455 RepID=H5UPN0_9MICO|nr:ISL3 family transposase [Mobilicoccus pelagius]GAB47688.1 putative transposase [Mobilicoccus pelagius NBRC 104925]